MYSKTPTTVERPTKVEKDSFITFKITILLYSSSLVSYSIFFFRDKIQKDSSSLYLYAYIVSL